MVFGPEKVAGIMSSSESDVQPVPEGQNLDVVSTDMEVCRREWPERRLMLGQWESQSDAGDSAYGDLYVCVVFLRCVNSALFLFCYIFCLGILWSCWNFLSFPVP